MKLNKLLPIATLTGVVTIVAPIATSCGCNKNNGNWIDIKKEVDTSDFKKHEAGSIHFGDVKTQYMDALKEDQTIFTNDFMFSMHETVMQQELGNEGKIKTAKYQLSNVSFDVVNKTISYDISLVMDILFDAREQNDSFDWGWLYTKDTISYVNMPFEFVSSNFNSSNATGSAYCFDVMGDGLQEDSSITIQGETFLKIKDDGETEWTTDFESKFDDPTKIDRDNYSEYASEISFFNQCNGRWMSYYVYDNEIIED